MLSFNSNFGFAACLSDEKIRVWDIRPGLILRAYFSLIEFNWVFVAVIEEDLFLSIRLD